VVGRPEEEAAVLVAHLPVRDQQRLRTAALALARQLRVLAMFLPQPLNNRILACSMA
jgi:hypothetical protein